MRPLRPCNSRPFSISESNSRHALSSKTPSCSRPEHRSNTIEAMTALGAALSPLAGILRESHGERQEVDVGCSFIEVDFGQHQSRSMYLAASNQ